MRNNRILGWSRLGAKVEVFKLIFTRWEYDDKMIKYKQAILIFVATNKKREPHKEIIFEENSSSW